VSADADAELVDVRLVGVPLRLRARSVEHGQDLLRELALVQVGAGQPDSASVPQRLLSIADELRASYGQFIAGPTAQLDAALDQGLEFMDLTYSVPRHARPFIRRVVEVLEEAEEFCRAGKYLLTLAAPPDVAAYRAWTFAEFDRQIAGASPTPWAEAGAAPGTEALAPVQPPVDAAADGAAARDA